MKHLPNIVTASRLLLVVPFVYFFIKNDFGIVLGIYIAEEIMDQADGKIAILFDCKSDTGKFFDAFVDSMSHVTAFSCLLFVGLCPLWIFLIFIWREFGLMFLRLLGLLVNEPVGSLLAGKIKALIHAITIVIFLWALKGHRDTQQTFYQTLVLAAAFASVFSGLWYIIRFRTVLKKAFI